MDLCTKCKSNRVKQMDNRSKRNDSSAEMERRIALTQELYEQYQENMTPEKERARRLADEAWNCAISRKNFQPDKAVALMTEAASIDPEHERGIQGIKNYIERKLKSGKVNLGKAINAQLTPYLISKGFILTSWINSQTSNPQAFNEWKEDLLFTNLHGFISVGRTKFGKELGLMVWKNNPCGGFEGFDVKPYRKQLQYLNQDDLEVVIKNLIDLCENVIIPWLQPS